MVAAEESEILVRGLHFRVYDLDFVAALERRVGVRGNRFCIGLRNEIFNIVRVFFNRRTLRSFIKCAEERGELSGPERIYFNGRESCGICKRTVCVICAACRPVMIRSEIQIFVRVGGYFRIGVNGGYALELAVDIVDALILRMRFAGVVFLRSVDSIEVGAMRLYTLVFGISALSLLRVAA